MYNNLLKIGKRIKETRLAAGMSQSDLAEKLHLSVHSRQNIGNWENGESPPPFGHLLKMCEIFDCEMGYLLCEFDCKTREATNIHEVTGLSENAINVLAGIKKSQFSDIIITLSKLIEHHDFTELLQTIHLHIWDFNKNNFNREKKDINDIAKVLNCSSDKVKKYMESTSMSLIQSNILKIVGEIDKKEETSLSLKQKKLPF